jgi:rRNA pseudouridine-1189 N-methylase Emg1 (Nep1/Mra1 family)
VVINTKNNIVKINNVSRQLLSQLIYLEERQKDIPTELQQNPSTSQQEKKSAANDAPNKILTDLMSERHQLITNLFESYTSEEISTELSLVNEMFTLDNKLTSKSKTYKKTIADQVLKVKNSTKVTRFYQKY